MVISTTGLKGFSRFDPAYRQAGPIFSTTVVISTTGLKGFSRFDPAHRQAGPIFSTITVSKLKSLLIKERRLRHTVLTKEEMMNTGWINLEG